MDVDGWLLSGSALLTVTGNQHLALPQTCRMPGLSVTAGHVNGVSLVVVVVSADGLLQPIE